MQLDLTQSSMAYKTAQNLAIFAKNSEEIVNELAEYLNFDLNAVVSLNLLKF
jgi:sulfite reductase alpha subunit-like flavoprotein